MGSRAGRQGASGRREAVLAGPAEEQPPPPPRAELVCNRTFDKYSCWPDTPPNTTANISCPWYLPWYHKGSHGGVWGSDRRGRPAREQGADRSLLPAPSRPVQHRLVFKRCGPDGQWVRGPRGQPWRNASQCQVDDEELGVQVSPRRVRRGRQGGARWASPGLMTGPRCLQREVAEMYSSFQAMYTAGYSLSLAALLLALAILLGLRYALCPARPGGPWRADTDALSPQQAALHPKLHPREPACVLRAQGQLRAGPRRAPQDPLQPAAWGRPQREHLAE